MKRFSLAVYVFAFVTATLLFAIPSFAQVTTGSISGSVIDQTGAAVAGATVTAKNTQTGAPEVTQTNDTGYFKLGFLPVGTYDITISKSGFRNEKIAGAAVQVNADNSLGGISLE
ncbi:MAG: carboxypeptidase-like regulatory domain-containing protein, partial [Candidatus Acidiferrales bacterium]